jgi:hypothetical protein
MKRNLILLSLMVTTLALQAETNWQGQGEISFESFVYNDDHNPNTVDRGASLLSFLKVEAEQSIFKIVASTKGRAAQFDQDRSFVHIQDLYLQLAHNNFIARAGYQIFNWSALEFFHPSDVINSRNYDSAIEQAPKRGELALETQWDFGSGAVNLYAFPLVEKPLFPGNNSRLGGVQLESPTFVKPDGEYLGGKEHWQYGARFRQTLGSADYSFHFLQHFDRQHPILGLDISVISLFPLQVKTRLTPYYHVVNQWGGTLQYAFSDDVLAGWMAGQLLKVELVHRDFEKSKSISTPLGDRAPQSHSVVAIGDEKTWAVFFGHEWTGFIEYQRVFGDGVDKNVRTELNLFQNDVVVGGRYAFNDADTKEIYLAAIFDLERDHEKIYHTYYSQRLTSEWTTKVGGRWIKAPPENDVNRGLESYDSDDQYFLHLTRFF